MSLRSIGKYLIFPKEIVIIITIGVKDTSVYSTTPYFDFNTTSNAQKSDPRPPAMQHEVGPPILALYQNNLSPSTTVRP